MLFGGELLAPVAEWALAARGMFTPNGVGRQYGVLQRDDLRVPQEVWGIKAQLVQAFGLQDAPQEPRFQDFCGVITAGGAVHPHQDPNAAGLTHTRFNVLVAKPERGGVPVMGGVEFHVPEGGLWRCDAGRVMHWCTPVGGAKPRIVLSFGFLL